MKPPFQIAMEFIGLWEWGNRKDGGYTNDPVDLGGETKFGISKRAHPNLDIKNLTLDQALEVYKRDYWDANNLDVITLPMCVALMDAFVNHQPHSVHKLWVQAGDSNWREFIKLRRLLYLQIISKRPEQEKFRRGWMNRMNDLDKYCQIVEDNLEKEKAGV